MPSITDEFAEVQSNLEAHLTLTDLSTESINKFLQIFENQQKMVFQIAELFYIKF